MGLPTRRCLAVLAVWMLAATPAAGAVADGGDEGPPVLAWAGGYVGASHVGGFAAEPRFRLAFSLMDDGRAEVYPGGEVLLVFGGTVR